ncbi:hypothetical protein VN23_05165 [Janthinobacterium sp. B9-8]|nr:hypothetical protein VN23_05165 [Janthinobacterium sp. B9-8]
MSPSCKRLTVLLGTSLGGSAVVFTVGVVGVLTIGGDVFVTDGVEDGLGVLSPPPPPQAVNPKHKEKLVITKKFLFKI